MDMKRKYVTTQIHSNSNQRGKKKKIIATFYSPFVGKWFVETIRVY